jgi:cytochrome c551/c552
MDGTLRTRRGLESVIRAVTVAAVLHSCLWLVGPAKARGQEQFTQNPIAGSHVFGSKGCVKCHSVNGLGATLGPDLGQIARRRSFYELAATMWNHIPAMREKMTEHAIEQPQLSAREAGDLIAFLFTLDYFDPPGDPEAGKRLFVDKKCVVCHQIGTFGGVVGPSLDHLSQYGTPIFVAATMWNHGPGMAELMSARGVTRPSFTGPELIDLVSYLESVSVTPIEGPLYVLPGNAEEGRVLFTEKACNRCHSVRGLGGGVAPDLAEQSARHSLTEFAAAMWNKAPAMAEAMRTRGIGVPQLGAGEMADIVAFLYSVQYFAEAGDAESGRRLLSAKGCLGCHALGGTGSRRAADLEQLQGMDSPAAVVSSMWNHADIMAAESADLTSWPTLSPEQIADLMAFFEELFASRR